MALNKRIGNLPVMKNHTTKENSCQSFFPTEKKNPAEIWFSVLIGGPSLLKGKGELVSFHAYPSARQGVRGTDATGIDYSACASFHASGHLKGPSPEENEGR